MATIQRRRLLLGNTTPAYDPDAQAYITAVEAADGQALEVAVKDAINAFVVGCKADGIWNAIKSCCILAGARTLNGALVQLIPNANPVTNFNFISADYNRTTGLIGNGTNKYLDSNRAANASGQDNFHMAVFANSWSSNTVIGGSSSGFVNRILRVNMRITGSGGIDISTSALSFVGGSRSSSTQFISRVGGVSDTISNTSSDPGTANVTIFAQRNGESIIGFSDARLSFYSIGEAVVLALLDVRVTTYMNTLSGLNL